MKFISNPDYKPKDSEGDYIALQQLISSDLPNENILETDFWFSDDGQLFMYKYRVMFGYRIRAGYMRLIDACSELDICCGAQKKDYDSMFNKIKTIIEHNPKNNPFLQIPRHSNIKPYFNDDEFCDWVDELYQKALTPLVI